MAGNKPNLSDPLYEFDKTKGYKRVTFQQGKPVLDVDLNDISHALESQSVSALVEKMNYGPSQTNYNDWVIQPVDHNGIERQRNIDNFAIGLGRLDTFKGIVDTHQLNDGSKEPRVIFDYNKIDVNDLGQGSDIEYGNYLLKGTVTAVTSSLVFRDSTKDFDGTLQGHRLAPYDEYVEIGAQNQTVTTSTHTDGQNYRYIDKTVVRIREAGCRVVFTSGSLTGNTYTIASASGESITISVGASVSVGDQYIIIPPNTLTAYRNLYNATTTFEESKSVGLDGLPQLLTYVQVFEEDISSSEESDFQSTAFGAETTHRSQLRWCVRVAMINISIDGDSYNNQTLSGLSEFHIRNYTYTTPTSGKYYLHRHFKDSSSALGPDEEIYGSFWRDITDGNALLTLGSQGGPFTDSFGLTAAHFLNSKENSLDNLFWLFAKVLLLRTSGSTFNDFVVLNLFNSETKSSTGGVDIEFETLSTYFYPNVSSAKTNGQVSTHSWLATGTSFVASDNDTLALPAVYKTPPRVLFTHADISTDIAQSRTLFGLGNSAILGSTAPLVFDSTANHLSFVDQALLGMSGLGSAQGANRSGSRIPATTNFTLADTTTGLASSGYGVGKIERINPLAASTGETGFVTGSSSYLLREKGSRSSHTVNYDDSDLGWSFYKAQNNNLVDSDLRSDFSVRGWEEGMAQSVSFLEGLNFRKLAIKTVAHKSQDLFTISEAPLKVNNELGSVINQKSSSVAFQIPYNQSEAVNGSLFLDSYSGSQNDSVYNANYNANTFIPANVSRFDPKPLLEQYQATGGIYDFTNYPQGGSERSLTQTYGAWNRFNVQTVRDSTEFTSDANAPTYVNDLWSNRCTAMRLRYHVGDFYPGADDARGVPRNLLVDSLNLFVKVEPLSLAHWMTMPKHQHSILENSISFAEGIESLLKIAHGLGDTQKLINASNEALIQANSPALTEIGDGVSRVVGDKDPLALPFEHYKHPFVHWYHPAMHKIQAPHPDGTNDSYTNTAGNNYKLTVYPKWGRRSLIIPALVPSTFAAATLVDTNGSEHYTVPYLKDEQSTPSTAFPDIVSSDNDASDNIGIDLENVTGAVGFSTSGLGSLPYPIHASKTTNTATTNIIADDTTNITFRNNQITFPAVGSFDDGIRPGPVFLPASRVYASQAGSSTEVQLGFNTLLQSGSSTLWDDIASLEDSKFPYIERDVYNTPEAGGVASDLPSEFITPLTAWSTPVMRAGISTHTVAGVVELVRTSFSTGLGDLTLSTDYNFTMPTNVFGNYTTTPFTYDSAEVPTVGPDNPVDTLFVGDLGTALGGFADRSGFISPLHLGIPVRFNVGLMPNDMVNNDLDVRDSFERAAHQYSFSGGSVILNSFSAINNMGLQQKLMWNCSFRVLHSRPSGMDASTPTTAPKSITEVFLGHNRIDGSMTPTVLPAPSGAFKKPFIHLMSTHPATHSNFPNKTRLEHLYPMVSDGTGGTHDDTAYTTDANGIVSYDYTTDQVKTSSMGDTYAVDPFDYAINNALLPTDNPLRQFETTSKNSGIEIDLLHELGLMHATPDVYGIDTNATINGTNINLQSTMPTANELTLPGDHELVFVLYTGHYGAKMYDTNDDVDISYIPAVAGCHLTATLEINRPSERIKSTATDEHHYGKSEDVGGNPINTYSIPSSK